MADFYSNWYGPDVGATNHFTTLNSPQTLVPTGLKSARVRSSFAQLTVPSGQDLADNDVIRLLDLKSSDRLIELIFSMDANWGATADFNVGLYLKGAANTGAVVDEDLFVAAADWSGAIATIDQYAVGTLDDFDRGKQLWEAVNAVTASTYSADPHVMYTVAATCSSDNSATAAAVEFLCEAYYVAGD